MFTLVTTPLHRRWALGFQPLPPYIFNNLLKTGSITAAGCSFLLRMARGAKLA